MEIVLLPVNGTISSDHAVDEIIHLYRSTAVPIELHLVNVQWRDLLLRSNAYRRAHGFHLEAGLVYLQSAKDKLDKAGIPYTCHVLMGDPVRVIPAYCEVIQCQRIVMGSRVLEGGTRRLFSSISSKIAQRTNVPVMVIPENLHLLGPYTNRVIQIRGSAIAHFGF